MKKILKEDIKSIEKKKKDLKDFILKTKQSLKSIYENKNYLDDFSDKKIHKLNKTSSSGFFPKMKYIKIIIIVFKIIILKNILKEIEII